MRHIATLLAGLAILLLAGPAGAEQYKIFGPYVVHYSAVRTDSLPAEALRLYDIKRSHNRALVSIAIRRRIGPESEPVSARVTGTATTLAGQQRALDWREAKNPDAVYYLADFRLAGDETYEFKIRFQPEGEARAHEFDFRQAFFTR